jgi:hypothetical protein
LFRNIGNLKGEAVTFEEFDQRFPNGLYDAKITDITIDYVHRQAKLQLSLRLNQPDSPNRNEYQQATLVLIDFYYIAIEPPDADHLRYPRRPIQVTGYPEDSAQFPLLVDLKEDLATNAFCCRFYVHDLNSFIHVAAKGAEFSSGDSVINRST